MEAPPWWQRAVFYQIYPRSFADSNSDGIGDFAGMRAKLDYLRDLGINAIWLSPHYPSPFLDCGYDISDYTGVAPEYGSLDDFTAFLHAAHERDIRVILDLVLNHTSNEHPWFIESRSSRDNPKRDWYVWRDGTSDAPPNNWVSIFGGSAWEHDAATDQAYYHVFLKEQPDLNWRNPAVKQAMWDAVRFWLDLGVDGFRLDAIATIFEHPDLPNHTLPLPQGDVFNANLLAMDDYQTLLRFQIQQPGMHDLMRELRALLDEYPGDRVLVGEDEDIAYHGANNDELHLVFNFPLLRVARLNPAHIRANQEMRLGELPPDAWPCNTLGNHDSPRVWSRYGDGMHDAARARLHAALILTLKGTPFLYNGEEIGMTDLELTDLSQIRDTAALNQYRVMTERMHIAPDVALQSVIDTTRDRCRSPLQWDATPNSGFSPGTIQPWLPVNPNYATGVNVASQERDEASLLAFYRRLIHLRQATPALTDGDYQVVSTANETCLVFLRHDATTLQTCLVALNFAAEVQTIQLDLPDQQPRLLFTSGSRDQQLLQLDHLALEPFEITIIELQLSNAYRDRA